MLQDLSGKSGKTQGPNRAPHVPVSSPKIHGQGLDIVTFQEVKAFVDAERKLMGKGPLVAQSKKKGLPVPDGVKFLYLGRPSKGVNWSHKDWEYYQQGVVTVAWIESSPGVLHLGFSFCSPKDRWCKITGRDMAMARLLTPIVIPFLYDAKRTVHEVVRAVVTHDFMRLAALTPGATMIWERVPSWTMGLAKRLMGGTKRERQGWGKTLGEKLAWLRAQGLNLGVPPIEIELPLTIVARMMQEIAALGNE